MPLQDVDSVAPTTLILPNGDMVDHRDVTAESHVLVSDIANHGCLSQPKVRGGADSTDNLRIIKGSLEARGFAKLCASAVSSLMYRCPARVARSRILTMRPK